MTDGSRKAIFAAVAANFALAITKFIAWLFTGAASMLAEAVHSLADTANQALLLFGGARAQRAATPEHPFGYGRERYFWSFVVAIVLFLLGGLFAIYEGASKLQHPHPITSPGWAIGESGSKANVAAVRRALDAHPQITRVLHLRTQHLGPDELLVAGKVEFDGDLDFRGVAAALNEAEAAVRAAVPAVGIIYLEPDVHDPSRDV